MERKIVMKRMRENKIRIFIPFTNLQHEINYKCDHSECCVLCRYSFSYLICGKYKRRSYFHCTMWTPHYMLGTFIIFLFFFFTHIIRFAMNIYKLTVTVAEKSVNGFLHDVISKSMLCIMHIAYQINQCANMNALYFYTYCMYILFTGEETKA